MNWNNIKERNYEVTDDFVEKVEKECLEEGIFSIEWDVFCVRFGDLMDTYEECKEGFFEYLQEYLEEYENLRSILLMSDKEASSLLDCVYREGYRNFRIISKDDEEVYFDGGANIWNDEEDDDFFTFYDENGYDCGRRFPRNRYKRKQQEIYDRIVNEFCGYTNEIIEFIRNADSRGDSDVFGDIRIHVFEVDRF